LTYWGPNVPILKPNTNTQIILSISHVLRSRVHTFVQNCCASCVVSNHKSRYPQWRGGRRTNAILRFPFRQGNLGFLNISKYLGRYGIQMDIYCAQFGTSWDAIVGAYRAVCNRVSRYHCAHQFGFGVSEGSNL